MKSETTLQNFLEQFTDARLTGDDNARDILAEYDELAYDDKAYEEAIILMNLIEGLQAGFLPVKPSTQFKARLKHDLLNKHTNVLLKWRFLPARVQVAALSVVIGGFLFLLRGLLLGDGRHNRKKTKEVTA